MVLTKRHRLRAPNEPPHRRPATTSGGGSGGRAMAGAIRIGNAVGAAFTNRRVLEPVEARLMALSGLLLLGLSVLFVFFPRVFVYPVVIISTWIALALLYKAYKLYTDKEREQL
jgi:cardiolipin synthase